MTNLLDAGIDFERSFLEKLVEDLEGTFHCIAHAGKADDTQFIKDRQNYIRKKYSNGLDNALSLESHYISQAYGILQDMLEKYKTPKEIIEAAEEALYSWLMVGIDKNEIEEMRKEWIEFS